LLLEVRLAGNQQELCREGPVHSKMVPIYKLMLL